MALVVPEAALVALRQRELGHLAVIFPGPPPIVCWLRRPHVSLLAVDPDPAVRGAYLVEVARLLALFADPDP